MTERERVGGLQVAKVLYDFVQNEALPGIGVDSDQFGGGVESVIADLAPKNKVLLAVRDEIQGRVDVWSWQLDAFCKGMPCGRRMHASRD